MRMVWGENGPGWFCCDVPNHTDADGSLCGRGLNRGHGEAWRGGAGESGVSGFLGDGRRVACGFVWTVSGCRVGPSPLLR